MSSSAWLPLEVHPSSTSTDPLPASSAGGPSGGPSTPTGTPSQSAAAPILKGPGNSSASESIHELSQPRFGNASGYVVPASSFSYNVLPNSTTTAGGSLQSTPSHPIDSNPSVSPAAIQPQVPGLNSSAGPFLYNVSQTGVDFPTNRQFQSSTDPSSAFMQSGPGSPASTNSWSVPLSVNTSSNSAMSSTSNVGPTTTWMPSNPLFSQPLGLSGIPGSPAPPGLPPSALMIASSASTDSTSSAVLRPGVPTTPASVYSSVQHQIYPTYPSLPPMGGSPQGLWLQPPQMGVIPRPQFLPYPAVYPAHFPLSARGMPQTSVPLSDSQPSGVSSVRTAGAFPTSLVASGYQAVAASGIQAEAPSSGIDNKEQVNDVYTKERATADEKLDAWTAHKTDTGVVYYYNAVTGKSTYEKPAGFKGELDKVPVQPTPISMEYLADTDWALVSTNDGKKYYYNSKTKVSSWQIPSEVIELRKKQDDGISKEHLMSVPNTNNLIEKGSAPTSLSAPAVNTGGRDAASLRSSSVPGSSALDLIKKKLQDSGTSVNSPSDSVSSGTMASELNGSRVVEVTVKGLQSENSKDKLKDANGDGNMSDSSSDSEDGGSEPTKECVMKFKEMLKERGVAPFSKWEKELPKILFDPRFKAIPSQSARRALFEHFVKTRAEEERKEKRAAQKAAIEGFKQLLEEASEEIDHKTDYQTFRKKWGSDPRFMALDRKDRELFLNERVLPLKRAAEEKVQAVRAATASSFKSMLREKGDITVNCRWSRVKDSLRNDPRYKYVKHEDREVLFNEYISELKAAEEEAERETKAKRKEQEKLKERERERRKRKEREEQEMERVRLKVRRKEAVTSFQALLVETIKDPQASWTESKPKLEKDPQGRAAANPDLDSSDMEKLFREHIKMLYERCVHDFKAQLAEVITAESAGQETEDGKNVLNSWSTAKRVLKEDPRYNKMPRKDREALWRRYAEEMLRKQLKSTTCDQNEDNRHNKDAKSIGSSTEEGGARHHHSSSSRRIR